MANKPIIEIPINADQFKAFYELFKEYEARVETLPKEWREIDVQVRRHVQTANSLSSTIRSSTEAQRQFNIMAREGLHTMSKMAKEAGSLGKSVFDIGKWLLKLGAIGGGIAGLGGILGAISLRDLAHSAVTDQRGARGVGLTTGQYKAFGLDFGRFLDPSVLSSVANAQNSYQGRVWLGLATGLGAQTVAGQGADQLAIRLATRAHEWWEKTPASQRTAENLSAAGFTQSGLSLDDVRRLGNTPMSELLSARAQYGRDQRALNVGNGATQAWYEFDRQISIAGRTIETSLTNRLVDLAPSLRSFVKTFTTDADQLINDIFTPKNLKALEDGVTTFTNYLGSPAFRADLKTFADGIADIASAISKVGKFFGGSQEKPQSGVIGGLQTAGNWMRSHILSLADSPDRIESATGLPAGILSAQYQIESGAGKNLLSPKGAMGPLQFMPDTWKQWGNGGNINDLHDSMDAAGRYDAYLMRHYGGDVRKALAAYNWGPGNVDRDIAANGNQWEAHLPAETKAYIGKIVAEMAKRNAVKVSVDVRNSTSARVAVQANAAAAGN